MKSEVTIALTKMEEVSGRIRLDLTSQKTILAMPLG